MRKRNQRCAPIQRHSGQSLLGPVDNHLIPIKARRACKTVTRIDDGHEIARQLRHRGQILCDMHRTNDHQAQWHGVDMRKNIPPEPATRFKHGRIGLRKNQVALPIDQIQLHANRLSGRLGLPQALQQGRIHTLTQPHRLNHQFNFTATGQPNGESIRIGNPVAQTAALPRLQCFHRLQDYCALNTTA